MKVRIDGPGEFDRYEREVRFQALADGRNINVTITDGALFVMREALGIISSQPLVIYAASGQLLKMVVADIIEMAGELQNSYMIFHGDVLRVTGTEAGLPHVPKPWKRF